MIAAIIFGAGCVAIWWLWHLLRTAPYLVSVTARRVLRVTNVLAVLTALGVIVTTVMDDGEASNFLMAPLFAVVVMWPGWFIAAGVAWYHQAELEEAHRG